MIFVRSATPDDVRSVMLKVRPNVLQPSNIDLLHPVVVAGIELGRKTYLSPTSSDQGWLDMPSVKMGPGSSARLHTANEFIFVEEIEEGIGIYIRLLQALVPIIAGLQFAEGQESRLS